MQIFRQLFSLKYLNVHLFRWRENMNPISDIKFLRPDGRKRPKGVECRPRKISNQISGTKFLRPDGSKRPQGVECQPRKINFRFAGMKSRLGGNINGIWGIKSRPCVAKLQIAFSGFHFHTGWRCENLSYILIIINI